MVPRPRLRRASSTLRERTTPAEAPNASSVLIDTAPTGRPLSHTS